MRRELGQLSLADRLVEGGAGRNRQLEKLAAFERLLGAVYAAAVGRPSYGPVVLLKACCCSSGIAWVRATGSAAPARYGGHRRPLLEPYETELHGLVEATPDITLAELQAALERRFCIVAGLTTIPNTLRRIGLRHKKSR